MGSEKTLFDRVQDYLTEQEYIIRILREDIERNDSNEPVKILMWKKELEVRLDLVRKVRNLFLGEDKR